MTSAAEYSRESSDETRMEAREMNAQCRRGRAYYLRSVILRSLARSIVVGPR